MRGQDVPPCFRPTAHVPTIAQTGLRRLAGSTCAAPLRTAVLKITFLNVQYLLIFIIVYIFTQKTNDFPNDLTYVN